MMATQSNGQNKRDELLSEISDLSLSTADGDDGANAAPPRGQLQLSILLTKHARGKEITTSVACHRIQLAETPARHRLLDDGHQRSSSAKARDGLAAAAGDVRGWTFPRRGFSTHLDHYSTLHCDSVYGFEVRDLIRAIKSSEQDVTSYSMRATRVIRDPPAILNMTMDRMYPRIQVQSARANPPPVEKTYSEDDDLDLPTSPGKKRKKAGRPSKAGKTKGERNARSESVERCLPCYLLPQFLASQSPSVTGRNNATLISFSMMRDMERHALAMRDDTVFFDCLRQLNHNIFVIVNEMTTRSTLATDIVSSGSAMRVQFLHMNEQAVVMDTRLKQLSDQLADISERQQRDVSVHDVSEDERLLHRRHSNNDDRDRKRKKRRRDVSPPDSKRPIKKRRREGDGQLSMHEFLGAQKRRKRSPSPEPPHVEDKSVSYHSSKSDESSSE